MPPVNTWFMAGAGGKIIGRGRDRGRGPGKFMNFGRGREGPGVVILAGAGAGAGAPVEHWFEHSAADSETLNRYLKLENNQDITNMCIPDIITFHYFSHAGLVT